MRSAVKKKKNKMKLKQKSVLIISAFFYEKKAIHHFLFSAIYLIVQYW